MTIFYFDSTGEAYDACQCDERIGDGDTLVIKREGVVGLAWAWPVALTVTANDLHSLTFPPEAVCEDGVRVFTDEQIAMARRVASHHGFPLAM